MGWFYQIRGSRRMSCKSKSVLFFYKRVHKVYRYSKVDRYPDNIFKEEEFHLSLVNKKKDENRMRIC